MRHSLAAVASLLLLTYAPLAARPQQSPAPAVDIAHLMITASRWTERFDQSLSGLLFRERYLQSVSQGSGTDFAMIARDTGSPVPRVAGNRGERVTEANVFLLRRPSAEGFIVYRDVYKIGSADVADHTERLQKLLVEGTEASILHAKKLNDASARLNIGPVSRNINVPTMALEYVTAARAAGLRVRQAGTDTIDGRGVVIVEFEEIGRPTLVRGEDDGDLPARGRYWIHPDSGAIVRAAVEWSVGRYDGRMEVRLALHPELSVWVPTEMTEAWQAGSRRLNGLAKYDRFQRLTVSTAEIVK
jgi:hypothetical protein